ncbi:MAG: hypothetical protein IKR42_02945 [Campylobacter sp.]|nr:hypothetical protein [Campylobacter sp.]
MVKIEISDEAKKEFAGKIINLAKNKSNEITLDDLKKKTKDIFRLEFEDLILADCDKLSELSKTPQNNDTNLKKYFKNLYAKFAENAFAKKHIQNLKVKVCPYCNRNYIINFEKNGKLERTAEFDHFYPKDKYPYFAVSIYNLIPCCHTCNHRKSKSDDKILNPFKESFNDKAKITFNPNSHKFYHDEKGIRLEFISNDDEAKNHIDIFNLKRLYRQHKDLVVELIQKAYIYNDSHLDELLRKYKGKKLFKNREDLIRLIVGVDYMDENINNRPFNKLMKDIADDLDLFKR